MTIDGFHDHRKIICVCVCVCMEHMCVYEAYIYMLHVPLNGCLKLTPIWREVDAEGNVSLETIVYIVQ